MAPQGSSRTAQHYWLAIEVLMEMARSLEIPSDDDELQELKQDAAEESYFGYGAVSDNLMLKAFGQDYAGRFGSASLIEWETNYDRQPHWSPLFQKMRALLQEKRHLLLVENLHVPMSLDVLVFTTGKRPSPYQQVRWLISATSKDVCDGSRHEVDVDLTTRKIFHLSQECYHAPPFDDLGDRDWATLIKEALWDAAGFILEQDNCAGLSLPREFWIDLAQMCLYYSALLYHPMQGAAGCCQTSSTPSVTSNELVRCWVAEDLFFPIAIPNDTPAATGKKQSTYYRSAFEIGKVVVQALQEYSLLPTGSTSWTAASSSLPDAVTGLSKITEGVPGLKQDELSDQEKSHRLRWVSFMNDVGRHVSWDWRWIVAENIPEEIAISTLILRGCSNISGFPFDMVLGRFLRVLDLSYTPINSLPSWISRLSNLHLLSLRGCSQLETLCPSPPTSGEDAAPLAHLGNLVVLDMNGAPLIEITQQDGINNCNLHYLDLSGSRITTLPSEFFRGMSSLEELMLSNCSNLKGLPPSMTELSNLLVLHVEGAHITSFPEGMFEAMQRLHTLKLINILLLASLPMSLFEAKGLKELHVYNCIRLRSLASPLSKARFLKELHIHHCSSLSPGFLWELPSCLEDIYIQAWESLKEIRIEGHPNLRNFSLSGQWVKSLSLRECRRIKIVRFSDDLTALEDVDLSGTAIDEIPHNLPNLPQLRMLLLLSVPYFKRFPWHQLIRFPKVFFLDHCPSDHNQISKMFSLHEIFADENQQRGEIATNTAQMSINDSRMFHSFNVDAANKLVNEGQFLQSFNVQVKSRSAGGKEAPNKGGERVERQPPYAYVHSDEVDCIMPMMNLRPKKRHVGISSSNQYPNGLRHLLSVTNSIFITNDAFVRCLTDLNYSLTCLEECQIQHCHGMEVVLKIHSKGTGEIINTQIPEALPSLTILQASNLNKLQSFVEPHVSSYSWLINLKRLKHIHLEHCPRLEKFFPCSLSLPSLETLVILFCPNLKTIFYKQPDYKIAPSPLPNIQRIYFQELPQLQHFHDDEMFRFETPKLEKLFVRGCQSFRRLPLLKEEYPKAKVEVQGERCWWGKLQLSLPEQSHHYLHVPPPEFASRKKHIIKSYLN
ncbi:unnamed protein product [Urochloa decumbens]|uniref:Uncharacterized protein n=1 Tax=Urochloa decumbens TaxID=240449 RepID=A0ABC9D8T6_9POAL